MEGGKKGGLGCEWGMDGCEREREEEYEDDAETGYLDSYFCKRCGTRLIHTSPVSLITIKHHLASSRNGKANHPLLTTKEQKRRLGQGRVHRRPGLEDGHPHLVRITLNITFPMRCLLCFALFCFVLFCFASPRLFHPIIIVPFFPFLMSMREG
jgi:hypothetical protein